MSHGEGEGALVLAAQEMLAGGQSDEEVFADLAARTGKWGDCVLAVCLALGVPKTDAEARLREVEPLFADFAVGEEENLAFVLGHVFIMDRVLDEYDEHIRDLLGTAAGARGSYPGSLLAWFRTGELTKIFLYFAKTQFRGKRGSPPDFWAAMTAAGELLASQDDPDHEEVTAGLARCRAQAAAIGAK
ncbi:hypothetical protein [Streptomyces antarcticus]|uniref:hypothetical protein n=1 Tax=Streptomyces antarcticus TaxID=2996458 RepID=UPI00226F996C|nr:MULTISPECIES: hypothetical protein [unclassified Streptomyces]MCY0946518.1 hypothetical protein [Streptomyces sp. H34-AA3]MCZ4087487.1 hypothetical protein [Streptomyces sp. H34-S5]